MCLWRSIARFVRPGGLIIAIDILSCAPYCLRCGAWPEPLRWGFLADLNPQFQSLVVFMDQKAVTLKTAREAAGNVNTANIRKCSPPSTSGNRS